MLIIDTRCDKCLYDSRKTDYKPSQMPNEYIEAYIDGLGDAGIVPIIYNNDGEINPRDDQLLTDVITARIEENNAIIVNAPSDWTRYDAIRNAAYYDTADFIGALTTTRTDLQYKLTLQVTNYAGPFEPLHFGDEEL